MNVLITGASGLIGQKIAKKLSLNEEVNLRFLTRNKEKFDELYSFRGTSYEWDVENSKIEESVFEDLDYIIHLAGENVAGGRWTKSRKERILNSRINSTRLLAQKIKEKNIKLKAFICASAVGIYGNRPGERLKENMDNGKDFLAVVCQKWEAEAKKLASVTRVAHIRTGIVLSHDGGALEKMLLPFRLGLGGRLGDGEFFMSWIHIDDLVNIYIESLANENYQGAINAVSPSPVTNKRFTKEMGEALEKPTPFPIPSFMLKLIFGEMSTILLSDQKVSARFLKDQGFKFQYPFISSCLENLLEDIKKGYSLFKREQYIESNLEKVFEFFSEAKNLEKITPEFLNFKIVGMSTPEIQEDTLIDYRLSLHGLPMKWRTKITKWKPNSHFVDSQLKGPYDKWIHLHEFKKVGNGTLMSDFVKYRPPLGILGELVAGWMIKRDVSRIFNFRRKVIGKYF